MLVKSKTFALVAALALSACGSSTLDEDIQPGRWSCQKLINPIIEMSKSESVKIFEITGPTELPETSSDHIVCRASAEWNRGEGYVKYGAHVSEGGKIVLEYQQEP